MSLLAVIGSVVTLLGSAIGLWFYYIKRGEAKEKRRIEQIEKLEAEFKEASKKLDYVAMRNISRRLDRLFK